MSNWENRTSTDGIATSILQLPGDNHICQPGQSSPFEQDLPIDSVWGLVDIAYGSYEQWALEDQTPQLSLPGSTSICPTFPSGCAPSDTWLDHFVDFRPQLDYDPGFAGIDSSLLLPDTNAVVNDPPTSSTLSNISQPDFRVLNSSTLSPQTPSTNTSHLCTSSLNLSPSSASFSPLKKTAEDVGPSDTPSHTSAYFGAPAPYPGVLPPFSGFQCPRCSRQFASQRQKQYVLSSTLRDALTKTQATYTNSSCGADTVSTLPTGLQESPIT